MPAPSLYLIGSLRNPAIPAIGQALRELGFDVFDDWFGAGPYADDAWRDYERERGHGYIEALRGYSAKHVFEFDYLHLGRVDMGLLVLPAGKSGHLELGFLVGRGKPTYILLDEGHVQDQNFRYDVMYRFATKVFSSLEEAKKELGRLV